MLVRTAVRRPWAVVLASLGLFVLAAFATTRVRVETDLLALVPEHDRVVSDYRDTLERFGSTDLLLVSVELGEDREAAYAFADQLAEALRASSSIAWLEIRLDDLQRALPDLVPLSPLYLEAQALDGFLEPLGTAEGLDRAIAQLRADLRSPAAFGLGDLRRLDPFGMVPLAISGRPDLADVAIGGDDSGYLVSPGGELLLMIAEPTQPAADLPFAQALEVELAALEAAAADRWRAEGAAGAPPAVGFAAGHLIAVGDSDLIVRDLVTGTLGALLSVVLLFGVAFRRPLALVVAFVPLLVGLAATFGFVAIAFGRLNSVTTMFAALLIGLGIDFVIVLYARYVEGRRAGLDAAESLMACSRSTALGVTTGAVTTAATFYAFLISDFRGLWELGLLTGTGILLVLCVVFLLLPALLVLVDRGRPAANDRIVVFGFGARQLFRLSRRAPWAVLAVAGLATVGLGIAATDARIEDEAMAMRSAENRALQARDRIIDAFDLHTTPFLVRVDGADEAQTLERSRNVLDALAPLLDSGELSRVESLVQYLPRMERQAAALDRLASFAPRAPGRDELEAAFVERGLSPAGFARGLDLFEKALARREPLSVSELGESEIGHLLGRYLASDDAGSWTALVYAYPPPGTREPSAGLMAVTEARPWASLTGGVVVSRQLRKIVWRDATRAALLGTVIVFLLLALDLGSARLAALALVPLGVGLVWMLGGMALFDVTANSMNLFVFTMIIGIGVDYGIHLLHRWQEGPLANAEGLAAAVAVAALTTLCGFGSLAFSHFPGLRSVGAAAILGTVAAAVVSVTVLPALLALLERRSRRGGGSEAPGFEAPGSEASTSEALPATGD
ncbi:MAG: MMPL family transporter [Acidobacteriota bacterium]